jgi:hypothetical protein
MNIIRGILAFRVSTKSTSINFAASHTIVARRAALCLSASASSAALTGAVGVGCSRWVLGVGVLYGLAVCPGTVFAM